jgi:hypothetical protein
MSWHQRIIFQYGSIVPNSVIDRIEEETAKEIRRQKESVPSGSESFDMETEEIRILPDFVSGNFGVEDDKIGIGSIVASLLHQGPML